jgi:hypothetical protein
MGVNPQYPRFGPSHLSISSTLMPLSFAIFYKLMTHVGHNTDHSSNDG